MNESSLDVRNHEGVQLVCFRDPSILDSVTIQRISRQLAEVVDEPAAAGVVLDFSNVRFLASEALRTLLALRNRAERRKIPVALCNIRPELIRVFSLTNLDQMFKIFENSEAAQEFVRGGAR